MSVCLFFFFIFFYFFIFFFYLLLLSSGCWRMVLDSLYIDICVFQPMEIYVDDETKLTLHGLVQVSSTYVFFSILLFHQLSVSCSFNQCASSLSLSICSTTFYWRRQKKTANWMIFLMHWTSTRLSFLSKVSTEQLSWTSYLLSVTSPLSASIQEWLRRRGLSFVAWIHFMMESINAFVYWVLNYMYAELWLTSFHYIFNGTVR